nr:MAG TPA: hypothetical protein [Caudoviricetes sp.]
MSKKLSPKAAHEKYLYNKKYMDGYWERRASRRASTGNKVSVEVSIAEELLPDIGRVEVTVCRNGHTDERYIKELERANKTLNSENRRLTKLLTRYQEIIRIGIRQLDYEKEIY